MTLRWLRSGALAGAMVLAATAGFAQGQAGQTGAGQMTGQTGAGTTPRTGSGQNGGSSTSQDQQGDSKSRKYVEHMLIANMAEIQLGQMGAARASSSDVKSFARQMVTEHTRANQELMPVAQQLGVQQPTQLDAKHQKIADKLSKAQGADFDRQFMKAMVSAHEDVVDQTRKIAGNNNSAGGSNHGSGGGTDTGGTATTGAAGTSGTTGSSGATGTSGSSAGSATSGGGAQSVTEYAAMTLPIVQQHLQHAQMLEETAGKNDKK